MRIELVLAKLANTPQTDPQGARMHKALQAVVQLCENAEFDFYWDGFAESIIEAIEREL
jgi:hypothetical protein